MEDTDTEKDSDGKPATKASSSMPGLDEYEFKDEEEEEDLSKALNDRHILRRELRQREKDDKHRNHVAGKQSGKGDSSSKSKKQKTPRVHCSSDTSSDEMESLSEKRGSPTCSQSSETIRTDSGSKKEIADQKEKGKVKRKNKSQNKNKENQEDGKENSKALLLSLATVSEGPEKGREEDSFKMSFSPKDDSSVHLFHLSSIKSPKHNHSLTDKQTPLKQENTKMCISINDTPASLDGVKYNHYTDTDYCTEGSSTKGCKHKEKSKHQQKDSIADSDDVHYSPYKDGSIGNSVDGADGALRKSDVDGKVVKKHKVKHKEKDKHRREYEAERSRHKQKEARKDGHRNLEFDREFWKENFFKSDETDESVPVKKEGDNNGSLQRTCDSSSVKEERHSKEKHTSSKDKQRTREEREKDKTVKRERREEKAKDSKPGEHDDRADGHSSGRILEETLQSNSVKEETEEKPVSGVAADQEQLELPEKGSREKTDKRLPGKERDQERMDRRHLDKERRTKGEHADKTEPQNSLDRWKEREKSGALSSHSSGDKNYKESEKLKSLSTAKKHEDGRRNKDKFDKRSDKDRQDREYGAADHREKDRSNADRRGKPQEKTTDHSKSDRSKDKDSDRKKKDKLKDGTSSNLKLLLEEKKGYLSESKSLSLKSKEDGLRTPEKDRERRDRDRDSDKHKDKDRHKDRSQQSKISKTKPSEVDVDRAKSKASPATRDAKPKEKRLVNDDLMQTSFERMLSLKDQEIEQWHRKHLEKIKQKERERLKQRPQTDSAKSRPKDRTKSEPSLSKELTRSKSSEASDVRDKPLRDGAAARAVSLDGKMAPSVGPKVASVVESCLSRSPRPDGERCSLMSRSVSLLSVASSEDSCQTATLTPRPVEFDSDVNPEASDSQTAVLQSSFAIQAARSPPPPPPPPPPLSAHDGGGNSSSLPDPGQSQQTAPPATSRQPETPCLRAILDEDAEPSVERRSPESQWKASATDGPTEMEESPAAQHSACPSAEPEQEGDGAAAGMHLQTGQDPEVRNIPATESNVSAEQKPPDALASADEKQPECSVKDSEQPSEFADQPPADPNAGQEREPGPVCGAECFWPTEVEPTPEEGIGGAAQDSVEVSEVSEAPSPAPSASLHIPSAASPTSSQAPPGWEQSLEDMDVDCRTSLRPSGEAAADAQVEDGALLTTGGAAASAASPKHRVEDVRDVTPPSDNCSIVLSTSTDCNRETWLGEGLVAAEGLAECKAEDGSEPMEVTPADERAESYPPAEEQSSSSGVQSALHTHSSSCCTSSSSSTTASGSSSPQPADRDSDASAARLKLRPLDEDVDMHVPHPRKRKMPKLSGSQACGSAQQDREPHHQSLAAMVDSVKLEEIEPYQTERANPYYEFLHIRKKIEEKRKVLCSVAPQPPQYYDEYVTFNGSYLLDGNPLSKLCIPTVSTFFNFLFFLFRSI